jgi:hypothetical protein
MKRKRGGAFRTGRRNIRGKSIQQLRREAEALPNYHKGNIFDAFNEPASWGAKWLAPIPVIGPAFEAANKGLSLASSLAGGRKKKRRRRR